MVEERVIITQRIVPGSRSKTGSAWEAAAQVNGTTHRARSRHGAPQALARALVEIGVADLPVWVVSDDLPGGMSYRSLRQMARWTFSEGNGPLQKVRYQEYPGKINSAV